MTDYNILYNYIENIRARIQKYCNVSPKVKVYITKGVDIGGECFITKDTPKMDISLFVPNKFNLNKSKNQLMMVILHEYSHFIRAIQQTKTAREIDCTRYYNPQYKHYDEKRTWKDTEKLAKDLGLWTPSFARSFVLTKGFAGK